MSKKTKGVVIILNLLMAGIDYSLANLDTREKFSFTKSKRHEIYSELLHDKNILGAVILSTCNRTELYLSCSDGYTPNPFELLCCLATLDYTLYKDLYKERQGNSVFYHLSTLACGAKSQIWGEDQIITQVKNSINEAREENSTDSCIEVLFRTAITAAKKIKTDIKFSKSENSVASKSLEIIKKHEKYRNVLVIGNGEVGRLTAQLLLENGYNVTMTLRHYKHSTVLLPDGVNGFDYCNRYERLCEFDVVVSATLSPHYTIDSAKFVDNKSSINNLNLPKLMIDLAVPRDIDPLLKNMGVLIYDIDTIAIGEISQTHAAQMLQINSIIDKYYGDFIKWSNYSKLTFSSLN